jgi:hypothetical protein
MWKYDFHIFYLAGRAVLEGQSPYLIPDFNSPFMLAVLFAPLSIFPEWFSYLLFIAINLILLIKILGKKSIWAFLSFPVLFTLFVGQVDLLFALIASLGSPWLLALLLAKPQVGFILLPYFFHKLDKAAWTKVILAGTAYLALCFIIRPDWVSLWLQQNPGIANYSIRTSNIFWLLPSSWTNIRVITNIVVGFLVLVLNLIWLKERRISWTTLTLVQPLSNIYSAVVLFEWIGPIEVILSWVAVFLVGGNIHNGMPIFLVPLSILTSNLIQRKIHISSD